MRCATSSGTKDINVYFIVKATRTLMPLTTLCTRSTNHRSDGIAYVEPSLYLNPSPNQPTSFFRWYTYPLNLRIPIWNPQIVQGSIWIDVPAGDQCQGLWILHNSTLECVKKVNASKAKVVIRSCLALPCGWWSCIKHWNIGHLWYFCGLATCTAAHAISLVSCPFLRASIMGGWKQAESLRAKREKVWQNLLI
jgi:hypothetical protein